jgi:hypothetical protein
MNSQGDDRSSGEPIQICSTELIPKVRQNRWSTSSGLLHRMYSQGEDKTGGALLQDSCTELIPRVRTNQVEHFFRTATLYGLSWWGNSSFLGLNSRLIGIAHNILSSTCSP